MQVTRVPSDVQAVHPLADDAYEQCGFCVDTEARGICGKCGMPFCDRHGRSELCIECLPHAEIESTSSDSRWLRMVLAIGMAAIATAFGAILGGALELLVWLVGHPLDHRAAAAAGAIVGCGLGWYWYATTGRRWIKSEKDRRGSVSPALQSAVLVSTGGGR
jgi:hypothetical protein